MKGVRRFLGRRAAPGGEPCVNVEADAGQGRIPFRLWIGVIGDGHAENEHALRVATRQAVARIRDEVPETETCVLLGVVSAESNETEKIVVDEIRHDKSVVLEKTLHPTNTVAGAEAEVVNRCDVLLALWHGTSKPAKKVNRPEIIESACNRVPVLWLRPGAHPDIEDLGVDGIDFTELFALAQFNKKTFPATFFEAELERWDARAPAGRGYAAERLELRAFSHWIVPYYARADCLAMRFQRRYRRSFVFVTLLAVAAVTTVTWGAAASSNNHAYAWAELVLLALLFVVYVTGHWRRWHDRWVASRFFAERLRSAYFLAITAVTRRPGDLERTPVERPPRAPWWRPHHRESVEWVGRSLTEIWISKPDIELRDVHALCAFLKRAWIDDQHEFHRNRAKQHRTIDTILRGTIALLFGLTIAAALLHATQTHGWFYDHRSMLIVAAVFFPTLAGALSAFEIEWEYLRNADRYAETVRQLAGISERVDSIKDMKTIRTIAEQTEDLLVRETRNWYALLSVHDLEVT